MLTAEREKDPDRDKVEQTFEIFFKNLDEKVNLVAIPEGLQRYVGDRVTSMVAKGSTDPLPLLVEIHFYYKADWISETQAKWGMGKLIGDARTESWFAGEQ